jgi:S1-C subfamily serine protease
MMNRLGAILSRRNDSFPLVFQHDTPLFPEQCGGPVLDLRGNVIGLNIARQGRAASLAIPASAMATIVDDLMRQSVANRR